MKTEVLDGGRLMVSSTHLALLRENGLDTFAKIMEAPQGQLRRNFPGRRTSRLELPRADGTTQAVFLKRYYPEYLSAGQKLLRRLRWPGCADEARAEWDAVQLLGTLGIPTLEVIARGQDAGADNAVVSSFVMTAELVAAQEGHHFARKLGRVERRRLLLRVAELTRKLHAAGAVHKDLYLGHYMVVPAQPEPTIFLIDLQRLVKPCCFLDRWRVKDLAALVYSSLKAGATRSDVAAAFRAYRHEKVLSDANRRLARKVLRRIAWLKTRTPKHDTDFEQLE